MDFENRIVFRTAGEEVGKLLPELSVAEASSRDGQKYGMKSKTLKKDYYQHKNGNGDTVAENQRFLLSAQQENMLMGWVLGQDASGLHVTNLDVIHFVR